MFTWLEQMARHEWHQYVAFNELPAFAVMLYIAWSTVKLTMCFMRIFRFWRVQRDPTILFLALSDFFQSVAFAGASLVVAPYSSERFKFLLPYVRLAWLTALPFFALGVIFQFVLIRGVLEHNAKLNGDYYGDKKHFRQQDLLG